MGTFLSSPQGDILTESRQIPIFACAMEANRYTIGWTHLS